MPDTPIEVALGVADRLCEKMANEPISVSGSKDKIVVTLSIGVSVSQGFDETAENLLKQADDFMYQAKKEGRNQVIPTPPKSAKGAVEALPG
jgi:diguanylate cyclase (GGDEF)-like protein